MVGSIQSLVDIMTVSEESKAPPCSRDKAEAALQNQQRGTPRRSNPLFYTFLCRHLFQQAL
jgi:hypothetical protein